MKKRKTVLITGGNGFIGSHLAQHALKHGSTPIVLDRSSHHKKNEIDHPSILWAQLDLGDTAGVKALLHLHRPEEIHHCAGHTQLRAAVRSPQRDAQDNVMGTLSLLQALLELKQEKTYEPRCLLFSSTAAVYGGYDTPPFSEQLSPKPTNPYGIAKVAGEQYLQWLGNETGIPVVMFRYANVYGPGQSTEGQAGVVAAFMDALVHAKPLRVYGDGSSLRDYIYVKDIVAAHSKASEKPIPGTYNLGTGTPTSTLELAKQCTRLKQGASYEHFAAEVTEQSSSWMSVKHAYDTFGWKAETSLESGLAQTFTWYTQQHESLSR